GLHAALRPGGWLITNFDVRPPSPENAWHLYDDDLNLRAILHRAGFVPAGRFGYSASSFGEYLLYRRADPAAAAQRLRAQFDLREGRRAAGAAGELQHISGADAVLEIGAASELNYRRSHPRALLFGEIAGYRPGRRVLTSSLSNPALMGLTLGLGPGLSDHELVETLRGRPAGWAKAAASYPAEPVDSGPVFENVVVKGE